MEANKNGKRHRLRYWWSKHQSRIHKNKRRLPQKTQNNLRVLPNLEKLRKTQEYAYENDKKIMQLKSH